MIMVTIILVIRAVVMGICVGEQLSVLTKSLACLNGHLAQVSENCFHSHGRRRGGLVDSREERE